MVFQRAFEANAKSITTSDELLSTLINLKKIILQIRARFFLALFKDI